MKKANTKGDYQNMQNRHNFDILYHPENVISIVTDGTDEKMVDHIRKANQEYLDDTAMLYMGMHISYRDLFESIFLHAKALKAFGVEKGDCAVICLPNTPETVYFIYACNEIGASAYLIDPRYTIGKIKRCLDISNAKLFICEENTYFSKIAEHETQLKNLVTVVVSPVISFFHSKRIGIKQWFIREIINSTKKINIRRGLRYIRNSSFLKSGGKYTGPVAAEYDPDRTALIINTSGTSGDSVKGAEHSDRAYNILANQTLVMYREIKRGYVYYGYIPFFSMYGSCVGMHDALCNGVVLDIIPRFDINTSIKSIIRKKPNILVGVPDVYDVLLKECRKRSVDMAFAKLYVMGGDNISPEKLRSENESFGELGMPNKIVFGYGSTEAMFISSFSYDERSYAYGSSGIPYPGVDILVIDHETGDVLENDCEGEICVKTLTMFRGYYNCPEENDKCFIFYGDSKYFRTGDKGFVTRDGHLYLVGRYKRLMKRPDGHQVSPIPIENAIMKHPAVKDCGVVGIKRNMSESGVIPTAFINLADNQKDAETVVVDIMRNTLEYLSGERENALAYTIVDSIPYTENGKLDYRKLEQCKFGSQIFYVIEDPITERSFKGIPNIKMITIT